MKKIIMILMVAAFALPTMAQFDQDQPQVQFQSTSSMQVSGSSLASQPMLNADGTAAYSPASAPAAGPKKAAALPPTPTRSEGDSGNVPLGDALIPLALMALIYGFFVYRRKRSI